MKGPARAAERISGLASFAGMVITLPEGGSGRLKDMADVAQLLRGLLLPLKAFLQSPKKKFVVLIHSREDTETLGRLLAEGMLGLFLSAAQEYPSVQFRTLEIEPDTDLRAAFSGLWTEVTPRWRWCIVMEASSPRKGTSPLRSSGIGPVRC